MAQEERSREMPHSVILEGREKQRTMKVEVLNIAEHTLKADASALYKEL